MFQIGLNGETDWDGWRRATRALVLAGVEPADVAWVVGPSGDEPPAASGGFNVPRALVELTALAIQARNTERLGLLYSLVWRAHGGANPLDDPGDPDARLAREWAFEVRAEAHRMRTHLRFMRMQDRFLGWYAPAHFVLDANAQRFAHRYPGQAFSIITPDGSAHWDGATLSRGAGPRGIEDDDTLAAWWEAHGSALLADAGPGPSVPAAEELDEAARPLDQAPIGPVVLEITPDPGLPRARRDASACQRCALHGPASQTVFGEGPAGARVMFRGGRLCQNSVSVPISGCPAGFSHGSPLGGVAEGGHSPTGAMPPNGGEIHAAIADGVTSK